MSSVLNTSYVATPADEARKPTSLADKILLAAWIFSYAALLFVFRLLKRAESRKEKKPTAEGG